MGAKLLLAEDSLTIQKVFELTFKQTGITLTVVDNGVDAVRLAKEISPDLVVADVSLPGKDGFEVASELRSGEMAGTCPVLILAGTLSPFDEERFRSCGADGVLFKPFESQELIGKVEDLIRTKAQPPPAEDHREAVPHSAAEPWDFSDVMTEMEREEGATARSRAPGEADLAGVTAAAAAGDESTLSLGDFDVSLEDVEGRKQPEEVLPEPDNTAAAEPGEVDLSAGGPEEREPMVEHIEGPEFEDSPPAVTDLGPAIESIEELDEIDFLEVMDPHEDRFAAPAPPVESDSVLAGSFPAAAVGEGRDAIPPHAGPPSPVEEELREFFATRAQEIFERVASETVERVLWEAMEGLVKEFREKIRESVEAVAWEVIPATTEALIREEIDRIREQAGKESS